LIEINRLNEFSWAFFDRHDAMFKLAANIGDKRYFITGASGLFGSWFISFIDWCHARQISSPQITALVRQNTIPVRSFIKPVIGSLESFNERSKFDRLIHLAAPSARDTYYGMSDRDKLQQLYLGTKNILDFASNNVDGRCLFASSGAVYGGFPIGHNTPITELNRSAPLPVEVGVGLGLGKRVTEFLVNDYCRDGSIDAVIARCFGFVGPGLPTDLHYAIGNFVFSAVQGKDIVVNGDGAPIRSFMYLGDAIYWLLEILENGNSGEDYNVGSTEAISIEELAKLTQECINPDIKIIIKGISNSSPGNPINYFYVPDVTKSLSSFNLLPPVTLQDAIIDYGKFLATVNRPY